MNRRVDLDDWQHVRERIRPIQLAILTRDSPPSGPRARDDAPAGHRRRSTAALGRTRLFRTMDLGEPQAPHDRGIGATHMRFEIVPENRRP